MEPMKSFWQSSSRTFSRRLICTGPFCSLVLAAGMTAGVPGFLRAAITTFSDQTSFTASLENSYYLNNFTGVRAGEYLDFAGGTGITFSYRISASDESGVTSIGMDSSSGLGDSMSIFEVNKQMIITFTGVNKPTAVGGNFFWSTLFDGTPTSDDVIAGTIRADLNIGGSVETIYVTSTGNSSIGFGGFTTDGQGFDSLTLSLLNYSSGDYYPTLDNFYVGINAVPEASGWVAGSFIALFAIGRTGFGFLRRRAALQVK